MKRRLWIRLTPLIAATGGCVALTVAIAAPHVPALVWEGYPSAVWPARGAFATIDSVSRPASFSPSPSLTLAPALAEAHAKRGTHALLVYQRGALRLAHYAPGFDAHTRFNSFSMSKALVGALALKAHADGLLPDLSAPVGPYLPDAPESVRAVPIQAFLDMQSGIGLEPAKSASHPSAKDQAGKVYDRVFGGMGVLHHGGLEAVLSDLRADPAALGAHSYQNVNTAILATVLERLHKRPIADALSGTIWKPAGAAEAYWRRPAGDARVGGYCCLYATAEDWLRVGLYIMRNGEGGAPFLPEPLWRRFLGSDLAATALRAGVYRDHLGHDILDRPGEPLHGGFAYFLGSGGQITYLMPDKDLVVVRFGERMPPLHSTLYELARAGVIVN
ncbi:MAG: serine hydrolase [Hyphomicrobiales bacterium]|nr:serine hydrolase [Hyphomicrobiales bacterium]